MKQGIFMRATAADATEATIEVIGVIGWEVAYQEMRRLIKSIPDTVGKVFFDIYSPGGDVWEGNGIIQDIGAMKQETVARVQVAASMATLIAVACKTREIAANGRFLIHNPWTQVAGDAASLEKRAKELRDCELEAAAFYASRTGQKSEDILKLMDEERWLTPAETKELGFVQSINDPFNAAAFADVKAEIVAAGKWPMALVEIPAEPAVNKPEEKPNGNANAPGTASKGAPAVVLPVKPEDEKCKAADAAGYARAQAEIEIAHAKELAGFAEQLASRDVLIKQHQSAKDKAEAHTKAVTAEYDLKIVGLNNAIAAMKDQHAAALAEIKKQSDESDTKSQAQISDLTKSLKDANERNGKLLGGGMAFEPAGPDTWEEAMQACNGDYVAACKKYPKLKEAYVAKNKRK
jgi:ATP-dependent protease ClpP protease subunit